MNVSVLTTRDADEWHETLERLPADVYLLPEYHAVCEANGEGSARAFVAVDGDALLLHTLMLRDIDVEGLRDAETAYGYGGPVAARGDAAFIERAWGAFGEWCRDERVVAEFVRCHPLLENHRLLGAESAVRRERETVTLPLPRSVDELWSAYPSTQRNMVRRAAADGIAVVRVDEGERLPAFAALYAAAMERIGAAPMYDFSDDYFKTLRDRLAPSLALFEARNGEQTVAAGLFLVGPHWLHYHLAASAGTRAPGAANAVLHAAAAWGIERGLDELHLGGGTTSSPDDPLFRFKASISRGRRSFYTGRRVHDEAAYRRLCEGWRSRSGSAAPPDFFLLYRLPIDAR